MASRQSETGPKGWQSAPNGALKYPPRIRLIGSKGISKMALSYYEQFRTDRTGHIKNKRIVGILQTLDTIEAKLRADHDAIQKDSTRSPQWKTAESRKVAA